MPTALAQRLGIDLVTVPIETGARRASARSSPRPSAPLRRGSPTRTSSRASAASSYGGVERPGMDRAHHGEQERVGHRVLDAVRRLGRRLRRDQGRPQDPRVPVVPVPQRPRRARSSFPESVLDQGALGRAASRSARRPEPASLRRPRPLARGARPPRPLDRRGRRRRVRPRRSSSRVAALVDGAEYKRRQSPPGVRITAKAFGKDRRMPITNRYRDPAPEAASAPTGSGAEDGAMPRG